MTLTRRQFNLSLAGSLAGLGSLDKMKPSAFGGILVGVQSYTFRRFTVDKMIETMKALGLSNVELWNGHLDPMMGLHNHWFADAPAERRALEFETPTDFADALKNASSYLAINLDIGHFHAAGFDPVAYVRENHKKIVSLHIKDRDRDPARTQRRFGQGATPIVETMALLRKLKFKYAANIEYEPEQDNPTEGVRDAIAYLRNALER
jgi:sugar phosphate isomerase/epimerase